MALLVGIALTSAGAIVYAIEWQRIQDQVVSEIDQELGEFGRVQKGGLNPDTGAPFTNVGDMLDTFLLRNVPGDNEILISWYDGGPRKTFPKNDFAGSDLLDQTVRPLIGTNQTVRLHIPHYGEAMITVQSVRSPKSQGALVIVTYLEKGRAGLRDTMRTYAIVSLLALLIVTAMAAWLSGRLLAPLRLLRETADEISGTDLSRRLPVTGNDDITALTKTVNGMLDRLEHAFVGQRQFLDDAGHELKTPLTVLRGHLELLDSGSPEEVAETRELLLDEVDRMARLVGDLILLAKSDRPDFVTPQPVEIAGLTEDLLAKARGLGDREWILDEAGTGVIPMDVQRITQAVLQLADNAVKHTWPKGVVAIGSSYDGTVARIWVRDTGVGVPASDRELIFQRFGRSEVSDGDEGFGLGLSIVRAIAVAHGGSVSIEEARPPGAVFVLTLPGHRTAPSAEETTWPAS
ncbi:MAG: ATP-binding region, ATPase domain protein [Nocardioides sp.]|nr:ATP-binding region, ATPase domain protein [Nocardioides sp.]